MRDLRLRPLLQALILPELRYDPLPGMRLSLNFGFLLRGPRGGALRLLTPGSATRIAAALAGRLRAHGDAASRRLRVGALLYRRGWAVVQVGGLTHGLPLALGAVAQVIVVERELIILVRELVERGGVQLEVDALLLGSLALLLARCILLDSMNGGPFRGRLGV